MVFLILYLAAVLLLLIFLMFMSVYTALLIYSSIKGSPYVPTRAKIMEEIFTPANLKKNKYLIELGSGDGRMVRFAAKTYGVKGLGVDVNPLLVLWSNILAKFQKLKGVEFKVENIFHCDMRKADYVYIFLMPELIEKLVPKMNKELRKGTIVISHAFPIKPWKKKLYLTFKRVPFPTHYYRI